MLIQKQWGEREINNVRGGDNVYDDEMINMMDRRSRGYGEYRNHSISRCARHCYCRVSHVLGGEQGGMISMIGIAYIRVVSRVRCEVESGGLGIPGG